MNSPRRIFLFSLAASLCLLLTSCYGPCGPIWSSTSATSTKELRLSADQYAAAEVVYRTVLPGGKLPEATTNFVYCLSFGSSNRLPADFMARFANDTTTIRTGTNGLVFTPGRVYQPAPGKDYIVQPGHKYEAASRRDVVQIMFNWISFHDNRAKARLYFTSGSENITEIIKLAKQHGEWAVTGMNEEMRTNF